MTDAPDEQATPSSRRDLLKKGAIVGGAVWAAPVVQTLTAGPAGAAGSVPPSCVLTVTPAPGVTCAEPAGTAYRGRTAAGGGQYRLTDNGGGVFTVTWPVTPVCTGSGCAVSAEWTWTQDNLVVLTPCTGQGFGGFNNANLTGGQNQASATITLPAPAGDFGITLRASVTFTCGTQTSTETRAERLRRVGGAIVETYL